MSCRTVGVKGICSQGVGLADRFPLRPIVDSLLKRKLESNRSTEKQTEAALSGRELHACPCQSVNPVCSCFLYLPVSFIQHTFYSDLSTPWASWESLSLGFGVIAV